MPKGKHGYSGGEKFARGVVAGAFSGAFMNVFVYPMDLVRTRLTTDVAGAGSLTHPLGLRLGLGLGSGAQRDYPASPCSGCSLPWIC